MNASQTGTDHGWERFVDPRDDRIGPATVRWTPPGGRGWREVYATRGGVSVVGSHHLDTPEALAAFLKILALAAETHARLAGGTAPADLQF